MRRCLLLLGICLLAGGVSAAPASITLQYRKINGFGVRFVAVNLRDPHVVVTTAVATPFPTGLESWNGFLHRLQPDAAINGTYFCPRSCMPVGDIAVDGHWIYRGVAGTALCITPDNRAVLRPGPRQAPPDWAGFRTVLCAGPRLLTDGQVTLNPKAEGFRDPHVLGSAPRSAVALRPDGLLLLLTIEQNISLMNLACVCLHLGATEAMALDGGSSSGLYAAGRTVTRPGRSLSNILAVYRSPERFQAMTNALVPRPRSVLARLLSAPAAWGLPHTPLPPAPPTVVEVAPGAGLLKLTTPADAELRGTVPITVEVARDTRARWASLRINGRLCAMTNVWPLEYAWDSTKETDGEYLIEASLFTEGRTLLEKQECRVAVCNARQVAHK